MTSRAERHAPRLMRVKHAQARIALAAAQAQHAVAAARQAEAEALRSSAQGTLDNAQLVPEQGLSRSDLYDRLRSVAVARAHALESTHVAGELEAEVRQLETAAEGSRQTAAQHHHKEKKLQHWHALRSAQSRQRRERRRHTQEQEDFACQRRSFR